MNRDDDNSTDDRPIRWGLVERMRREIAAGLLDAPGRLEAAVERLIDRHALDADRLDEPRGDHPPR